MKRLTFLLGCALAALAWLRVLRLTPVRVEVWTAGGRDFLWPRHPRADQSWFWTEEWQAGERAADADIAAGRVVRFDNVNDLIAWLKEPDPARGWTRSLDELPDPFAEAFGDA